MQKYRTYKRKLILTKEQEQRIVSWTGVCRLVYNMGLEIKRTTYKATQKNVHCYDLQKQITEIRNEYGWIKDVPYEALADATVRLDKAFSNFFRTLKSGGGYPRYASKRNYKTLWFKRGKVKDGGIWIPKLGIVKTFNDEPIFGVVKNVCITQETKGFFICILCENVPPRFESENQAIGLDMGISHFCIDSNGKFISNPKHFKKYERRLRIENRSLARKKKGTNSWRKQAKRLALLHHKIANVRKDFLHKESTTVAKMYSTVYMENLNISGMSKNRKLSKHILDAGWGIFKVMLQYKTNLVLVNAKHTSQICNSCGVRDASNRRSQSDFICTSCGHSENADVNAAKNIISRGTALSR